MLSRASGWGRRGGRYDRRRAEGGPLRGAHVTGRRARPLLVIAVGLLTAMLAVFAVLIIQSHAQAKRDVRKRFKDRAIVSSALTGALLQSAAQSSAQQSSKDFAGPTISAAKLETLRRQGRS